MRKYLKFLLFGLFTSFVIAMLISPTLASQDLREDQTWWMTNGERHRIEQFLFKNETVSGFCSNNCYELSLSIYDVGTQQSVSSDVTPKVSAPRDGVFEVEVAMVNCARRQGCRAWLQIGDEE